MMIIAFRPIFYSVPYTVPYTSPTRPLRVPYVPYKHPTLFNLSASSAFSRPALRMSSQADLALLIGLLNQVHPGSIQLQDSVACQLPHAFMRLLARAPVGGSRSAPRRRFNVGACNPWRPRLRDTAAWTSAGDLPWDANPKTKSNSADERCGAMAKSRHTQRDRDTGSDVSS